MDFDDAVHTLKAGSHLLESWKQLIIFSNYVTSKLYYIRLLAIHKVQTFKTFFFKAVTFSHMSGEPMSHFPSTEVERGSKLADITERLEEFHGYCQTKYDYAWLSFVLMKDLLWTTTSKFSCCMLLAC